MFIISAQGTPLDGGAPGELNATFHSPGGATIKYVAYSVNSHVQTQFAQFVSGFLKMSLGGYILSERLLVHFVVDLDHNKSSPQQTEPMEFEDYRVFRPLIRTTTAN